MFREKVIPRRGSGAPWRLLAATFAGVALFVTHEAARGADPAAPTSPGDSLALPPDSPRWELEGRAKVVEFLGRQCIMLDGGAASVNQNHHPHPHHHHQHPTTPPPPNNPNHNPQTTTPTPTTTTTQPHP
jgi:hypothetical protein